MSIKNKMRFELIRNGEVIHKADPDLDIKSEVKFSINTSINSFPILSFKSSNPEINKIFMGFSKNDLVRFSVSTEQERSFITAFEGEFYKKNIEYSKDPESLSLDVQAIHSFFTLSLIELPFSHKYEDKSFEEVILQLMDIAKVKSKVSIAPSLKNFVVNGISSNVNAFRLFKEICMIANASVAFNRDNTVEIDIREHKAQIMNARTPHPLTDNDIISLKGEDRLF